MFWTSWRFTLGLSRALVENCDAFPIRFWVIDNSHSMTSRDGHRILPSSDIRSQASYASCTRWEEIQECVLFHAKLSTLLNAPTRFKFLNDPGQSIGPQEFSIADRGRGFSPGDLQVAESLIKRAKPNGLTPLTARVAEIRAEIQAMSPELVRNGQKAVVVLATDGLPTGNTGTETREEASRQFVEALRSMERLPVWVVVRLCTDEEEIVEYYNNIDEQLELSLEVLDDFESEAKEVFQFNPWINYALPLHRIRELGFQDRVFDLIDERALTKSELRQFCLLLFGESQIDGVPDPNVDWLGFLNDVERMVRKEHSVWDPVHKAPRPWIDTKVLDKLYGDTTDCGPGCSIL